MNAIEFVKKHGWKDAKICLLNCASPEDKWFMRRGDLISGQDFDDLKQIVEAWELVERIGGFESAVKERDFRRINNILQSYDKELSDAISLLEQCQ